MYSQYAGLVQGKFLYQDHRDPPAPELVKLKPHHHIKLDGEFKLDCRVWIEFLSENAQVVVSRPMLDLSRQVTAEQLEFFSDATANEFLGFGSVFGNRWVWGTWPPGFVKKCQPSIEYLELFALLAGIFTWEKELSNMRILVF